jgi:predicted amidohydrolase
LSEPIPGPTTRTLIGLAKKNDIYVIMGMPEANTKYPGLIHNSAVLVGPEGFVGVFRKVHLPTHPPCKEILYGFAPGDEFPVFELKQKWRIGLLICYDTWFPEAPRIEAIKGADLLVTISANSAQFEARWRILNQLRAIENTVFHVFTNLVGEEWGRVSFFGEAAAFGPDGKEIVKGPLNQEAMLLAKLNARDLYKARSVFPCIRDRRPSAYREISDFTYPHM